MALPLARTDSTQVRYQPNAESWKKMLSLVGNRLPSLEYLEQSARILFKKNGVLTEYGELMQEVSRLVNKTRYEETVQISPWEGDPIALTEQQNQTDLSAFYQFLAFENAKLLKDLFVNQSKGAENWMNYAFNPEGQYVRNFIFDGVRLEGEMLARMDALFNAWLVEQGLMNRQGRLYYSTNLGEIQLDKAGNPSMVSYDEFKRQLERPQTGFVSYVLRELNRHMSNVAGVHFAVTGHAVHAPEKTPSPEASQTRQTL